MKHTCVLLEFLLHVFFFLIPSAQERQIIPVLLSMISGFLDSFSSGKVTDTLSVWFLMRCNSQ